MGYYFAVSEFIPIILRQKMLFGMRTINTLMGFQVRRDLTDHLLWPHHFPTEWGQMRLKWGLLHCTLLTFQSGFKCEGKIGFSPWFCNKKVLLSNCKNNVFFLDPSRESKWAALQRLFGVSYMINSFNHQEKILFNAILGSTGSWTFCNPSWHTPIYKPVRDSLFLKSFQTM